MTTKITKISAKYLTTLAKRVNVADTTATLTSIQDLDLESLPSGRYGFTVDEGNSQIEYFEADLSGSALSGIKRLDPTTLVETTGFLKEHRAGAEVKITDYTVLARIRAVILGEDNLDDGSPIKYGTSPTLSDPLMLATVEYVLSVVNGGTVTFDTQVLVGDAGETISSGQWVYLKESDGKWWKTDANTQATVKNVKIGMAKGAGTAGNAISGGVFVGGLEKTGTYTAGQLYYLSNTAGALSTSAGEFKALVGIGDANGELVFLNVYDPEGTTPDEKDALAGTVGTPNANNKFVTNNGTTQSGTDQSQTTQNSSVELGEANATTKKNKLAQSFQPTKEKIRGVKLYKSADTGTAFTGTVTVTLQTDTAGSPSGSALATKVLTLGQWSTFAVGEIEVLFASEYASLVCVPATTYWIVIETSTSDNSNHPNLGFNTAGGYSSGTLKYNNTANGWVEITGDDLYFKTLEGNASQVIKTDSEGDIPEELLKASKMPIPAFFQFIGVGGLTTQQLRSACSNQDGSILITYNDSNTELHKFERDPITGMYLQTASAGITPNADGCPVILGDYVYVFYDGGTNMICYRYLLSDLSGETLMTVPTIATNNSGGGSIRVYSDGKYFYFFSGSQGTTIYTLSVSSTTITQVTTDTLDTSIDDETPRAFMFDGTSVYFSDGINSNTTITIRKLSDVKGTGATTSSTKILHPLSDDDTGAILLNIDSERMYIGRMMSEYDEAGSVIQKIYLVPVSKP